MARTSETAPQSTRPGQPPDPARPENQKAKFLDHAGVEATRLRHCSANDFAEQDFGKNPLFAIQVYSTVEIDLDDDEPLAKRGRNAGAPDHSIIGAVLSYVDIGHDERPAPMYEVYAQQSDVFACSEHQRREIAYRKARREDPGTLLIPRMRDSTYHDRKSGALIVLTSTPLQWRDSPSEGEPPGGLLWVHFDRRLPSSYNKITREERMKYDPTHLRSTSKIERNVLPEKPEITVKEILYVNRWRHDEGFLLRQSYWPDDEPMMDFAPTTDEGTSDNTDAKVAKAILARAVEELTIDDFDCRRLAADEVSVSNHRADYQPDLQYIAYIAFPSEEATRALEHTARVFAAAIASRLSSEKTFSFRIRRPPHPTISSILQSYRGSLESDTQYTIGALDLASHERTFPQADFHVNPKSSVLEHQEPYKPFLIILDKPDFVHSAGVSFLMTDGGQRKSTESVRTNFVWGGPMNDYVPAQMLRSPNMDEATKRLSMVWPFEKRSS